MSPGPLRVPAVPHCLDRCCEARGRWTRPKRPRRTRDRRLRNESWAAACGPMRRASGFRPSPPPALGFPSFFHERKSRNRWQVAGAGRSARTCEALRSSGRQAASTFPTRSCDARPPRTFWTNAPPPRFTYRHPRYVIRLESGVLRRLRAGPSRRRSGVCRGCPGSASRPSSCGPGGAGPRSRPRSSVRARVRSSRVAC